MPVKLTDNDIHELRSMRVRLIRLEAEVKALRTSVPSVAADASKDRPESRFSFQVRLTQTGGSAGSDSTRCSFTYSVFDWYDVLKATAISTAVAVEGNGGRNSLGAYTAGTYGLAFIDTDGTLKLLWTNEYASAAACA